MTLHFFRLHYGKKKRSGFSLLEIVITLILLSFLGLFVTNSLTTVVKGYVLAKSSDAVAQKAQIALQRLTSDFSYLRSASSSSATGITYVTSFNGNETHSIAVAGNTLTYSVNNIPYILTDDVAANGLQLSYYANYAANATSTFDNTNTTIIGISLKMHGANWDSGLSKTFTTRVTVNKTGS